MGVPRESASAGAARMRSSRPTKCFGADACGGGVADCGSCGVCGLVLAAAKLAGLFTQYGWLQQQTSPMHWC
jgi:hypothetical protein